MAYVGAIAALFVVAGFGMISKLGAANSAKLELEVARAKASDAICTGRNAYMRHFEEAVASYR